MTREPRHVAPRGKAHQLFERDGRREPLVEHAIDALEERHVDAVRPGESARRDRRIHALGHHPEASHDVGELLALRERDADPVIA